MSKPKLLLTKEGRKFLVKDTAKDFHTQFGYVLAADLRKAKDGTVVTTNTGTSLTIFTPTFFDLYQRIKRDAQIIPLKDVGVIISNTGIGKGSVVVDAGAGSGGLCCFLAHIVKKMITYDIRDDFIRIVQQNKEMLCLKNLTIKKKDIYGGIDERNVDVIILDLPEPWKALESCAKALKHGGFLVAYSPTVPQISDFVEAVRSHEAYSYIRTIEIIERDWEFQQRKIRPKSQAIGHSGFLSFVRRV